MKKSFESKDEDHYSADKIAANKMKFMGKLLLNGDKERAFYTGRQIERAEYFKTQPDSPIKAHYLETASVFSKEMDEQRAADATRLEDATDERIKVAEDGSKFYNRPWNKGRIQEMAAQDAANQGIEIVGSFNRPANTTEAPNTTDLDPTNLVTNVK